MTAHSEQSQQGGTKTLTSGKTALKVLNSIAFDALKIKHPGINPDWVPRPAYKDRKANQLTQSIIAWIRLNGGQAERVSTTGRPIDNTKVVTDCLGHRRLIGSVTWIPGTSTRGSADVAATIRGKSVKIEVKVGRDRQSPDQIQYQKSIENAGGLYFIATSFEQFYQWYQSTFNK
jgi:hypothetical protein